MYKDQDIEFIKKKLKRTIGKQMKSFGAILTVLHKTYKMAKLLKTESLNLDFVTDIFIYTGTVYYL